MNGSTLYRRLLTTTSALALGLNVGAAHAQNAAWNPAPGSNDWDTGGNWTPAAVPSDTATFGPSNKTSLTFSAATTNINTLQFNAGAPSYTFTLSANNFFNINGAGIVNNSANQPTFALTNTG